MQGCTKWTIGNSVMCVKDLLFFLRLNHWLAHVSGMSQLNECVNVNECDSLKVRFSDPGKNALMVIKYKLHGSFSVFQWKRKKGRQKPSRLQYRWLCTFAASVVIDVRKSVHVFVDSSLAAVSSCSTLGSLHIWQPASDWGRGGWPPHSRDQERSRTSRY